LSAPSSIRLPTSSGATLTVRQREADPRVTPAGLAWRLVDDQHVEITRPTAPGFDRGAIYEFIYRARDPIVMGIGFAAIRDTVSFLRHDITDNPLAPSGRLQIRRALGFGISQSGRCTARALESPAFAPPTEEIYGASFYPVVRELV